MSGGLISRIVLFGNPLMLLLGGPAFGLAAQQLPWREVVTKPKEKPEEKPAGDTSLPFWVQMANATRELELISTTLSSIAASLNSETKQKAILFEGVKELYAMIREVAGRAERLSLEAAAASETLRRFSG